MRLVSYSSLAALALLVVAAPRAQARSLYATGVADITTVEFQAARGQRISVLKKGGKYRLRFVVKNVSPKIRGRIITSDQPYVSHIVVGATNGRTRCYDFYADKRFAGRASKFTNATITREIKRGASATTYLHFKWRCSDIAAATLPRNYQPQIMVVGATTLDPLPNLKAVPLAPNTRSRRDILVNGKTLALAALEYKPARGSVTVSRLEPNKRYRMRFVVANRSRSAWGAVWDLDHIRVEVLTSSVMCYQLFPSARFAAGQSKRLAIRDRFYNKPLKRGQKRAIEAFFIWKCKKAVKTRGMPRHYHPKVAITGRIRKSTPKKGYVSVQPKANRAPKKKIGQYCSGNSRCSSGVCDRGHGTQNTKKCVAARGRGRKGQFCSHNNQCNARRRLVCRLRRGKNYGKCNR